MAIKVSVLINSLVQDQGPVSRVQYEIMQVPSVGTKEAAVWTYPLDATTPVRFANLVTAIQGKSQELYGFTPLASEILIFGTPVRGDLQ